MLFHDREAADAARMVGYLSASQFSREYAGFFGQAPMRDVALLRAESAMAPPRVPKPS